jgi:hypothetical protein
MFDNLCDDEIKRGIFLGVKTNKKKVKISL